MSVRRARKTGTRFRLELPLEPRSARKARVFAAEVCRDAGLAAAREYRLLLALDELCLIVAEASRPGSRPGATFEVVIELKPRALTVSVRDAASRANRGEEEQGIGAAASEPTSDWDRRGLELVRSLADNVAVRVAPEGDTVTTLTFAITAGHQGTTADP